MKITRDYIIRTGGGGGGYDYYYDEEVLTVEEGDTCPDCGVGTMLVSAKENLYCSKICWEEDVDK